MDCRCKCRAFLRKEWRTFCRRRHLIVPSCSARNSDYSEVRKYRRKPDGELAHQSGFLLYFLNRSEAERLWKIWFKCEVFKPKVWIIAYSIAAAKGGSYVSAAGGNRARACPTNFHRGALPQFHQLPLWRRRIVLVSAMDFVLCRLFWN